MTKMVVFILLSVSLMQCKIPGQNSDLSGRGKKSTKPILMGENSSILPFAKSEISFFQNINFGTSESKHAHLMHLDGFMPEVFEPLLKAGRLPHFSLLLSRAKISNQASTVDKSETMKIILSYLTSQVDVYVSGWWSFARDKRRFENVFIDPVGVLNYNLGIKYPRYPTVFDFLSHKGEEVLSGFALHRRSVPYENYSRSYVAGLGGVFAHEYFNQADKVVEQFNDLFISNVKKKKKVPRFSNIILAPADEMGHLYGIKRLKYFTSGDQSTYCMNAERAKDSYYQAFFDIINRDKKNHLNGLVEYRKRGDHNIGYLNSVKWGITGKLKSFCIPLPKIAIVNPERKPPEQWKDGSVYVHPNYVMGMMLVDIQLGRMIQNLRSIGLDGKVRPKPAGSILDYLKSRQSDRSLFENTLFMLLGDHGMVPSNLQTAKPSEKSHHYGRAQGSYEQGFISLLNSKIGLDTVESSKIEMNAETFEGKSIGIDDTNLPEVLKFPQKYPYWQNPEVAKKVRNAYRWADSLIADVKTGLKDGFKADAFWKKLIPSSLVKHEIDKQIDPVRDQLSDIITTLYLNNDVSYKRAEDNFLKNYCDKNVRMIYGGAARNNAEMFLPTRSGGKTHWGKRPDLSEIMTYKGRKTNLLETLMSLRNVGLVFIRKNNGDISSNRPLPNQMDILVLDPFGRKGEIRVIKDQRSQRLKYGYRILTEKDPLGMDAHRNDLKGFKTYYEWNQLSLKHKHRYHNVVAGMGSYLYSNNPTVGDLTVMHATGWNFGANNAGHGGVHRGEKLTVMIASGPRIMPGTMRTIPSHISGPDGSIVANSSQKAFAPTVLDAAPTILNWLGHGPRALDDFRNNDFAQHYAKWNSQQIGILKNKGIGFLTTTAGEYEVPLKLGPSVQAKLDFLLKGYDVKMPPLPEPKPVQGGIIKF